MWRKARKTPPLLAPAGDAAAMKAQLNRVQRQAGTMPNEVEALCPKPHLLPGEGIDHYHAVQAAIFRDIDP